jgi:hypothetical protein
MRGKEFIEHDNPYDVGMTGCWAFVGLSRDDGLRCPLDARHRLRISSSIRRMRKSCRLTCGANRLAGVHGSISA